MTLRQWIQGFPEVPAPRRWFFAATALAVSAVALVALLVHQGGLTENRVAPAVHAAIILVAVSALCAPLPAVITTGILLQIVAVHPELRSPVVIFGMLSVVVAVAMVRHPLVSGVCALCLWYLALTGIAAGDFIPEDLESAAILGALFVAAWAGAIVLRESIISRHHDSERFKHQIEEEREKTVKALHGSVAASLTSVVLRSESMAMTATDSSREESLLIAEDARRAMREVRELIRFMRADAGSDFENSAAREPYTLYENLTTTMGTLRSHGFTVIDSGVNEESLSRIQLAHGYTVFRELKTNILKYGDRDKPVILAAVSDDDALTVAIQNSIADATPDVHMTTEIGLRDASSLVHSDGGTLTFNTDGATWRCELTFPAAQNGRAF